MSQVMDILHTNIERKTQGQSMLVPVKVTLAMCPFLVKVTLAMWGDYKSHTLLVRGANIHGTYRVSTCIGMHQPQIIFYSMGTKLLRRTGFTGIETFQSKFEGWEGESFKTCETGPAQQNSE